MIQIPEILIISGKFIFLKFLKKLVQIYILLQIAINKKFYYNITMNTYEIRVKNLINKRQLSIQLFSIVTGGIIGLLFLPFNIKTAILFITGIYYCIVLLNNYTKLDKIIDEYINNMEEIK